jgi:hypothetical protein
MIHQSLFLQWPPSRVCVEWRKRENELGKLKKKNEKLKKNTRG